MPTYNLSNFTIYLMKIDRCCALLAHPLIRVTDDQQHANFFFHQVLHDFYQENGIHKCISAMWSHDLLIKIISIFEICYIHIALILDFFSSETNCTHQ